jgi:hypothetical protein
MERCLKFTKVVDVPKRYKVKSPEGWSSVNAAMQTIKYDVWYLELQSGDHLRCADKHIVYKKVGEAFEEIFVEDVVPGDIIQTDEGESTCFICKPLGHEEVMYDLEINSDSHQYITNNLISHNTTCSCIYLLWYAIFNDDQEIAILANKQDTAADILNDIKVAYEQLPPFLKPGVKKYDNLSVHFDNGTKIFAKATSPDALRGYSVNLLFLDEFAFVEQNIADKFWASNLPTISTTEGSVIVVSTPNGAVGLFYDLWKRANAQQEDETTGDVWVPTKIHWSEHPDRDDTWKESMLNSMSKVQFAQEFEVSFTGSTYTLIDGDILSTLHHKEPAFYPDEGYYIWKRPEKGHLYAIGADTAKGANTDFHVLNIFDVTWFASGGRIEQVAMFRRNDISVFDFTDKIPQIAHDWNDAVLIIENNDLGHAVVHEVYYTHSYENTFYNHEKGEYGINSNKKTKPKALNYFKEDVESGKMIINSEAMIRELTYYEEVRTGIFQARKGREYHDDTVASGYWVSYLLRTPYWIDFYEYWTKNNNPNSKELQNIVDNENMIKDMETADRFMRRISKASSDGYEYLDDFGRQLSQ